MRSDEARAVLKVLTGGFVNVKLSADNTETYRTEFSRLIADPGVALAVAVEWVETRLSFPTIAEFVDECAKESERRRRRARAIEQAQSHKQPGLVACVTCDDKRVVDVESSSGALTVLPCPDCDPEMAAYWREGHYAIGHDVSACDHPRCRQREREGRGRRRTRGEFVDDDARRPDPVSAAQLLSGVRERLGAAKPGGD